MLEYDNSAFYYFSLTLLSIYLLPGLWFLLSELYKAFLTDGDIGAKARTMAERSKASKLRESSTGMARLKKPLFVVNLAILCVVTPIFIYLVAMVINDGEVSTFDPFQILGIDHGAGVKDIKKAYRQLSLKYHPDKNIGSKVAEEMFMKVTKAYEALTDPNSKRNWETYGNPDGKQSLEVSIGLPSIVLDNPKVVLVLYLIVMVILIPVGVGIWYAISKQYGEKNIMHETYTAFYQLLQETHRVKQLAEVVAASAECRALNTPKPDDSEPLAKLYSKMKNEKLMAKPKFEHPTVLRGNLLLHAHVLRITESLTPALRKDLDAMLCHAPDLVEGMIEIAYQRKWLDTTFSAIQFAQYIVQGLWCHNHPLMQLPHMTEELSVTIASHFSEDPNKVLYNFIRKPDNEKPGLNKLSVEQQKDICQACTILPHMKIETKLFVEEEEVDPYADEPIVPTTTTTGTTGKIQVVETVSGDNIYEQDLVTLRVTMTRENTPLGKDSPPVHAPNFPKTIREAWWLILTDKSTGTATRRPMVEPVIHAVEKVTETTRIIKHELRFMAPQRAGKYEMELHIFSDCYIGLDEKIDIIFDVLSAAELPEYIPHPEDVELDNEPTLFEQVMAANIDDSSEDEDEKNKEENGEKTGDDNEDDDDDEDE